MNIKGGKINIIPIENEFQYALMKGFMDIWMEMHSNDVVLYVKLTRNIIDQDPRRKQHGRPLGFLVINYMVQSLSASSKS